MFQIIGYILACGNVGGSSRSCACIVWRYWFGVVFWVVWFARVI